MGEVLYPIFYGTRLVPFNVLEATFAPQMHPEGWRRHANFIKFHGGKFGIGSGFRPPGTQPSDKPGFAKPTQSFHEWQIFPSGKFYIALDYVVVNPGYVHRSPLWGEVPIQGTQPAIDFGVHMNVGEPGSKGSEPWHGQPVEIDGWGTWVVHGRPDIRSNYPIAIGNPRPQPPQPPVPPNPLPTKEIKVEFNSRVLRQGSVGPDVKFFQRIMNDIAGQGLLLDGHFGAKTTASVKSWQRLFELTEDGILGAATQKSMIEVSLLST
jgi:peptidoglycan hydrolase-like protein with peptidoglycan-binding domain